VEINKNIFRLVISILLSVATLDSLAQIISDDFSDGNFTENPEWTGTNAQFIINTAEQLQLNDAAEGQSHLVSEVNHSISGDTEWRFYIRQSFSPSGNNNSRFYLLSSAADISYTGSSGAAVEGYFIQFGESGSDDAIEIFRNDTDGNLESVVRGTDGLISSSFEISIKIVRTAAGNWEIWADPNAGEEFVLQNTGSDLTYTTMNYVGWVCKYTSSNADNFFLDNLFAGDPIVDTEPPELLNLLVNSENELSLTFNEPLDQNSAENTMNYSVDGIGNPASAVLESATEVTLTFGQNFISGAENFLSINGVEDSNGNQLVLMDWPFSYFEVSIPQLGDLIISEIFADPSPAVGLPDEEWIEIYNTSGNTYDLSQVQYYNSTTLNELEPFILQPNSYVTVSSSVGSAALLTYGDAISASTFTALTNSGDSLTLVANGVVIDVVVYDDNWYQDDEKDDGGWSLERINPFTLCSGADNWIASSSVLGGTPSSQNSSFSNVEDITPPVLESISLLNPNQLFIQASESLNEDLSLLQITLDNGIAISSQVLIANDTGILLNLENSVELGQPFIVTVMNLTDCEGNVNTSNLELEVISGFPAQAGEVLITEIMADPSPQVGLPEVEYIEIYNTTDEFLDISDLDLDGATFVNQVVMAPFEYKVIMSEDDLGGNFVFSNAAGMDGWSSSFLTNSGKFLALTSNGQVLDELTYDISWYNNTDKDDGGWSLERINLEDPCSDRTNWSASESIFGGSPFDMNSVFNNDPDESAPEVSFAFEDGGELFIVFNEPLNPASVIAESFTVDGQQPVSAIALDEYTAVLTLSSLLESGQILNVEINGISDCWENQIINQQIEIGLPEEAEAGDIIINEVLSNPIGSGSDYVEIYNNSSKVISLENWQVAKRDEDGLIDQESMIVTFPFSLFPGEYLLLSENVQSVVDIYPNAQEDRIWVMDLPSFSNDEDEVVLLMSELEISDELHYSSDFHFGLLDDTDGVSLERVSFDIDTQYEDNWSSASSSENFGTPGYINSQNQALQGAEGTVSVYPEVFAPEGGTLTSNHLEISYSLSFGDGSAKVEIYDKNGVLVRTLVNNQLIGPSGTYLWDGLDDNQQKLPVGIYVIYFEVFTLSGEVESYKVPAVIGQI